MRKACLFAAMLLLPATPPAHAAVVPLGTKSNGAIVRVRVGDRLVLRLPANASTGYSWSIATKGGPLLRLDSARYVAPAQQHLVGAPGTYVARFTVRAAGRARLALEYVRRTHPATAPASRFAVTIAASPR